MKTRKRELRCMEADYDDPSDHSRTALLEISASKRFKESATDCAARSRGSVISAEIRTVTSNLRSTGTINDKVPRNALRRPFPHEVRRYLPATNPAAVKALLIFRDYCRRYMELRSQSLTACNAINLATKPGATVFGN